MVLAGLDLVDNGVRVTRGGLGGPGTWTWTPPPEVLTALPRLSVRPGVLPPPPVIPATCGARGRLGHMVLAWQLTWSRVGRPVKPKWATWPPGVKGPLELTARYLQDMGIPPAAISAVRWDGLVQWSGRWPKGPGALYSLPRVRMDTPAALDLAQTLRGQLVPPGPAAYTLAEARARLDQAVLDHRPASASACLDLVDRVVPDHLVLVAAAEAEVSRDVQDLRDRLGARSWVWRA